LYQYLVNNYQENRQIYWLFIL